jgi:hypothetical protein
MKLNQALVFALSGAAAGIAFVLSCSDHTSKSDAATCDCPASEPPIVAGRIKRITQTGPLPAQAAGGQGVSCPDGSLVLSGSCTNPEQADVVLRQSGITADDANGWECFYKNNTNATVTIKATAFCLSPTP